MFRKNDVFYFLIFLFFINSFGNWRDITPEFAISKVYDYKILGDYEFVILEQSSEVYRKKIGDSKWELVFVDPELNENSYKNELFKMLTLVNRIYLGFDGFYYEYCSSDYGSTWEKLDVDKRFAALNYTCTSGPKLLRAQYGNVEVSSDFGKTWEVKCYTYSTCYSVCASDNVVFAGGWGKIFKSNDYGQTWDSLGTDGLIERTPVIHVKGFSDSLIYASTDEGLYYSKNNGFSWMIVNDTFNLFNKNVIKEIVDADSLFFAMTTKDVYRFKKSDNSFKKLNLDFNQNSQINSLSYVNGQLLFGANESFLVSSDLGESWKDYGFGIKENRTIETLFFDGNNIFLAINSGINESFIFKSNDTFLDWEYLMPTEIKATDVHLALGNLYAGTYDNNSESDKNNVSVYNLEQGTYTQLKEKYHPFISGNFKIFSDTIYSTFLPQGLYRSYNNGVTWDTIAWGMSNVREFHKIGNKIIGMFSNYKYGGNISISTDNGDNFKLAQSDKVDVLRNAYGLVQLGNLLYIANSEGDYLCTSQDTGKTWTSNPVTESFLLDSLVYSYNKILFAINKYDDEDNSQYAIYSTDLGSSWNFLKDCDGNSIDVSSKNLKSVYYGEGRIFLTNKGKLYTKTVEELIEESPISNNIKILPGNEFKYSVISNSINVDVGQQNFINEINIYNLKGVLIKSLDFKDKRHNVKINSQGFGKGFYLLNVNTNKGMLSKALILK